MQSPAATGDVRGHAAAPLAPPSELAPASLAAGPHRQTERGVRSASRKLQEQATLPFAASRIASAALVHAHSSERTRQRVTTQVFATGCAPGDGASGSKQAYTAESSARAGGSGSGQAYTLSGLLDAAQTMLTRGRVARALRAPGALQCSSGVSRKLGVCIRAAAVPWAAERRAFKTSRTLRARARERGVRECLALDWRLATYNLLFYCAADGHWRAAHARVPRPHYAGTNGGQRAGAR